MIQNGELVTQQKLFESIDELASVELSPYISNQLGFSYDGEYFFDLKNLTPLKYANIMVNAYDVPSSSRALDKQLFDLGYRTTYKFAYKYHIAPQMRQRIVRDAYVLDYFMEVFNHPNLLNRNSENIQKYAEIAVRYTYYYAQFIWVNNPGIYDYKNLNMYKDWYHIWNFVIGAGFEYHPLDIKHHEKVFSAPWQSDKQEMEKQHTFKDWCKTNYNIDTGCLVLSDTNRQKLEKILTHQDTPYLIQVIQRMFKRRDLNCGTGLTVFSR